MERDPIRIDDYLEDSGALPTMAEDVRRGLTARQKSLPPKYFYDERGSRLFEAICETPEYYPTRTEMALLRRVAGEIVGRVRPRDLVELGPGSADKARFFLEAMEQLGTLGRYVPVDVSAEIVERSARALLEHHPDLRIKAVIGDFFHHLDKVPDDERRLVVFLGSTIGNLERDESVSFLRSVAALLRPGDAFLLGADLVKDEKVLEAAYNDAAGVTEEFNRNILLVVNHHLGADFQPETFRHVAFFNAGQSRIEIYLEATHDHTVRIRELDLEVSFRSGERIHTEFSHKFTRRSVEDLLREAGMKPQAWFTDPREWFSLALAGRG
jgi:L-histidine N-alpha-methyltransferase